VAVCDADNGAELLRRSIQIERHVGVGPDRHGVRIGDTAQFEDHRRRGLTPLSTRPWTQLYLAEIETVEPDAIRRRITALQRRSVLVAAGDRNGKRDGKPEQQSNAGRQHAAHFSTGYFDEIEWRRTDSSEE